MPLRGNVNKFHCFLLAGVIGDAIFVSDFHYQEIFLSSPIPAESTLSSLPIENLVSPHFIAIDPFHSLIYWTDMSRNIIGRSSIDGKSQEIIHSNVPRPKGIALDLVGGNVYWISTGTAMKIEVSRLNGRYRKVLVPNLPSAPFDLATFDLALDTTRG